MKNIKMVANDAKVLSQTDTRVAGLAARSWVSSFTVGQERTRHETFFVKGKRLFFVIADAVPATSYPAMEADIDALLRGIQLKVAD